MKKSLTLFYAVSFCFWIFGQPANDNPCGAIALLVNNYCSMSTHTTVNSTDSNNGSTITSPGCASYNGRDVWFSFTVPATGNFQVSTSAGSITDGGMALYTASTCNGTMNLLECNDDSGPGNMPRITRLGMPAGQTIYVRMWRSSFGTGTFNICVMEMNNCGSANNNDNCPSPATLFQGTGDFTATTDQTFNDDEPGNLSNVFCGTIENNSWYKFTASSTTHSFPITYVGGCADNRGIQAHVYQVTTNASGCCTNFVSKSNCYNPGNTSLGTVVATNLVIGQEYMLMIDGYAGDGCEFTISGWRAINVLPVELVEFSGVSHTEGSLLHWVTESETNNNYFEVLHSRDGVVFQSLAKVESKGNGNTQKSYSYMHEGASQGINYYKLKQVDFDGTAKESHAISVLHTAQGLSFKLAPNPAKTHVNLTFESDSEDALVMKIFNLHGQEVDARTEQVEKGTYQFVFDVSTWRTGVYTLVVSSKNATSIQKLIVE